MILVVEMTLLHSYSRSMFDTSTQSCDGLIVNCLPLIPRTLPLIIFQTHCQRTSEGLWFLVSRTFTLIC